MMMGIKKLRHEKGFTLIELMAVLAILAVIVAIAVPAVGTVMAKSTASAEKSSIELMERAGELAHLDGLGFETEGSPDERYEIPTLVSEGYLKLETDSPFHDAKNYVVKQQNGTFVYNGVDDVVVDPVAKSPSEAIGEWLEFGDVSRGVLAGTIETGSHTYNWTVPYDGLYTVEIWGAQGAKSGYGHSGKPRSTVSGDIVLRQGSVLSMVIGQQGEIGGVSQPDSEKYMSGGGGGGGGSSAVLLDGELLVQARGTTGGSGYANKLSSREFSGVKLGGFGYKSGGSTHTHSSYNYQGGVGGGFDEITSELFDAVSAFTTDGEGNGQVRVTFVESR